MQHIWPYLSSLFMFKSVSFALKELVNYVLKQSEFLSFFTSSELWSLIQIFENADQSLRILAKNREFGQKIKE